MASVTMPPSEEARTVFERLGYSVTGDGPEFVAERKWRSVRVQPLCSEDARRPDSYLSTDDDLLCFVTWKECAEDLRERVAGLSPSSEWAIIGVDDDGDFEVHAG